MMKAECKFIRLSAAKGIRLGLQRCWRPQQKCLQELGLWTGTVKAAVVHNGLANLQNSVQDTDSRPGLCGSQGEQWEPCVRNEAHWNYCQANPGWDTMGERTALAEPYSTPAWCLDLARDDEPFHSQKDNSKFISFTASSESLKAIYLSN